MNMTQTESGIALEECRAVEQFLFREARLLDEGNYDGWMEMLDPDLHYWMPLIQSRYRQDKGMVYDPDRMAHFDENLDQLRVRVNRFKQETAWAENPATRHCHFVTNVEVEATPKPSEYQVHSLLISLRNRNEDEESWLGGRRRDVIRRCADGQLRLVRRHIFLTQSVLLSKNLNTFF